MTLHIKKITYYHYQSGYKKNRFTLTVLIKLRVDIERAMISGEVALVVFIDFSKAFDTIDSNNLIHKLHPFHFLRSFLCLILNCLSNRIHFMQIDSRCSNPLYSKFGVPQGSK